MKNILELIASTHNIDLDEVLFKKTPKYRAITYKDLLEGLLLYEDLKALANYWDYGYPSLKGKFSKYLKPRFPKKENNSSWKKYLLLSIEHKNCSRCLDILPVDCFGKATIDKSSLRSVCRSCASEYQKEYKAENRETFREYEMSREAKKLQRTPSWANLEEVKEVYKKCPLGYEVDHIIPLQGRLVSGFHIASNLQYLTKLENSTKGNRFIPG